MGRRQQVVVVGGGPVGVALAIDLASRGVSCALVDPRTELSRIPKVQNLTQRTMEHFRAAVGRRAEGMVADAEGHLLVPVSSRYCAISAASLVERLHDRPERWLEGCNGSDAPVLMAWGGDESRAAEWAGLLDRLTAPERRGLELPGVGHEYGGAEQALADAISTFVDDVT